MKLKTQHIRKKTAPPVPPEPTEVEIRHAAHQLWLDEGCPAGCELKHWLTAEGQLRHEHARANGHTHGRLQFPPNGGMVHPTSASVPNN